MTCVGAGPVGTQPSFHRGDTGRQKSWGSVSTPRGSSRSPGIGAESFDKDCSGGCLRGPSQCTGTGAQA